VRVPEGELCDTDLSLCIHGAKSVADSVSGNLMASNMFCLMHRPGDSERIGWWCGIISAQDPAAMAEAMPTIAILSQHVTDLLF